MNLTKILESAANGDSAARAELIEVAYQDLKQIAQARMRNERLDHTLTATALVSEVSLKLLKDSHVTLSTGKEFYAYVSAAMRNFLIDHARSKLTKKRGGKLQKFSFDEAVLACETQSEELVALNDALQKLTDIEPRKAQVVEMRYFGGMSNEEVAQALDVSLATVKRDWSVAKSWLIVELSGGAE
ncbi:MAG: ECF-type sigma factor [Planctomycetota bacterium]